MQKKGGLRNLRKKNSAFCYLYDSIVAQIAAGRFPYGASLPSASQLCGIYQVGLRTVRDVMPVLQRDGYIRTQERRRPVVVYRPAAPLSAHPAGAQIIHLCGF